MYQTLVRDWRNEQIDLRHFTSPIAARNLANDIPDEVVDTLLEVCQRNAALFQRYFQLKARWLGMERLRRYDIYAPVAKSDKTLRVRRRRPRWCLDSFDAVRPAHRRAWRSASSTRTTWTARCARASAAGPSALPWSPDLTPWVLLNYQGRPDDVATMAHELGHAIHSMLAAHHSLFTFHSSLPLAETASTFGEMMLIDRLLAEETDEDVRRDLLFRQVDDAYATILRQAFFALFERQAHEMVQQGAIGGRAGGGLPGEPAGRSSANAVEISDEFRWEWVSIPHIYQVPFYVYAYTFGQLLVLSLYQQFKAEGEAFKPRYLKILSAGGSEAPAHILSEAGIDIYSAEFWQGGFDVLADLLDRLEAIPVAA